jgi:hypothetical protein
MTESEKLVRQGLGWETQGSPKRKPLGAGKLSKDEILELTRSDCARGADGLPVLFSSPTRITKKIKL